MVRRVRLPVVGGGTKVLSDPASSNAQFAAINASLESMGLAIQALQNPPRQPGTFSAPPTAKVGLTPVSGGSPAFMSSDSAPPIDQGISPTWTGTHAFANMFAALGTGASGQVLTLIDSHTPAWRSFPVVPGPAGEDGHDGYMGPPGRDGSAGAAGSAGPPGYGYDGLDGDMGPPGQAGAAGAAGATGAAGGMGPPGNDGRDGDDGDIGPPGQTGATGATGSTGSAGGMGPPGNDGRDGDDGDMGPPGQAGATGAAGAAGLAGSMGPPGFDGLDGEDGYAIPGATGPTGASGAAGLSIMGPPGFDGLDGEDGYAIPGATGPTGIAGINGYNGLTIPGMDGADGLDSVIYITSTTNTGGGTGANPTATIGLTAVNGTALTFLRSDGAPALSQAIVPTWTGVHTWTGAGAVGVAGSPIDVILASGAYGINIGTGSTATFPGLLVMDAAAARVLEIIYAGATSGGVYGAPADSAVINAGGGTSGGLVLSTNDLARILITNGGITTIQGGAGATPAAAPLQLITGAAGYGIVLTDGTGIGYVSFGASHEIQFGSNTQGFDLIAGGGLVLQAAASGQINLSAVANIIGGVTTGNAISINQGANTSPALAYTSTGTSGEAFTASWSGTGANLIISSDIFIGNVAEIFTSTVDMWIGTQNVHNLIFATNLANRMSINGSTGLVTIAGAASTGTTLAVGTALTVGTTLKTTGNVGFNGATPVAKLTGWGTPVGPAVVANLPSSPTVLQLGQAVGEIIVFLKNLGLFGA